MKKNNKCYICNSNNELLNYETHYDFYKKYLVSRNINICFKCAKNIMAGKVFFIKGKMNQKNEFVRGNKLAVTTQFTANNLLQSHGKINLVEESFFDTLFM